MVTSIHRHLWYLSEELVPLALCDRDTPGTEKAAIVRAMLAAGRPQHFPPQKPLIKTNLLDTQQALTVDVRLHEFAGERSWLMFERMDLSTDWMQNPPSDWPGSPHYMVFKNLVDKLEVVNDCAESVKDVTEFINYAKDPARLDRVMMVVNHHRQLLDFSNLSKAQMDNMDDFL